MAPGLRQMLRQEARRPRGRRRRPPGRDHGPPGRGARRPGRTSELIDRFARDRTSCGEGPAADTGLYAEGSGPTAGRRRRDGTVDQRVPDRHDPDPRPVDAPDGHRRATGRPPRLTADHDGVIVADVVAEWAGRHGEPYDLASTGLPGARSRSGQRRELGQLDAIDFCRVLSRPRRRTRPADRPSRRRSDGPSTRREPPCRPPRRPGRHRLQRPAEIPGLGFLPVNAFLIHAEQPVVIDTGLSTDDKDFVASWLSVHRPGRRAVDLADPPRPRPHRRAVRPARRGSAGQGRDHVPRRRHPRLRAPLPLDRVHLLNPGQQLDVGDRRPVRLRPPLFDSPATVGVVDHKTGALFSSDCFGAPLPSPDAALAAACGTVRPTTCAPPSCCGRAWTARGCTRRPREVPGHGRPDPRAGPVDDLQHPPAAARRPTHTLLDMLSRRPTAPFVGPDQAALEAMLAGFALA